MLLGFWYAGRNLEYRRFQRPPVELVDLHQDYTDYVWKETCMENIESM